MAFSPTGQTIVSGSADRTLRVWDSTTGETRFKLLGHTMPVATVSFRPDGTTIASAAGTPSSQSRGGDQLNVSAEGELKLWDAETGVELLAFASDPEITPLAWSPDGNCLLACDGGGSGQVLETVSTRIRLQFRIQGYGSPYEHSAAVSPDGKGIASIGASGLRIWDSTGELRWTLRGEELSCGAWSPDSSQIAIGYRYDVLPRYGGRAMVSIWDASNGKRLLRYRGHECPVGEVAWSPDGKKIVSGGSNRFAAGKCKSERIQVWDARTGETQLTLEGYVGHGPIRSLCFSPDGDRVVAGFESGTVKTWDARTGEELITFEGARRVSFSSPDGAYIFSQDGPLIIWDANTGKEIRQVANHASGVTWRPIGDGLLCGWTGSTFRVWDAKTGRTKLSSYCPVGNPGLSGNWSENRRYTASINSFNGRPGVQLSEILNKVDETALRAAVQSNAKSDEVGIK